MITKEQKIINAMQGQFPVKAYPVIGLLAKLRETFEGFEFKSTTILEIHSMMDLGNEGGIGCDIRPIGLENKDARTAFLCSITHLKIKVGEPHFEELETYRIKRIKKLALQNGFR